MIQKLKTAWLKARIAWHRRQAISHSRPERRTFRRRESYVLWMHNQALEHSKRAAQLERELARLGSLAAGARYPQKAAV